MMAEFGVVGEKGMAISGWTTTRQDYTKMTKLTAQNIAINFSAVGKKSVKVLTLDCPQDITVTATVTTSHANGYSWFSSGTYFVVYDASMAQVCSFNHASGTSQSSGTLSGNVSITLRKGINYLYFEGNVTYLLEPINLGFTNLSIDLGYIYPIFSPAPSFGLQVI